MNNISLIVEFENATLKGMEELQDFLRCLKQEIVHAFADTSTRNAEILCVHPGGEAIDSSDAIQATLKTMQQDLAGIAEVQVMEVTGARYYELKNEAARQARGDIIVFVDSDIVVTKGWLRTLLAPFADPQIVASSGLTTFLAKDFISRTFALIWFFPLVNDDGRLLNKRGLVANNVAFRRDWFVKNPYPQSDGFKVSCTLHNREINRQGAKIARTDAVGYHHFWEGGLPFLLWRAAVTGRDMDRKFSAGKERSRLQRSMNAISAWGKRMTSLPLRIVKNHRKVGMPFYEVPLAIMVSWWFYSIVGGAQLAFAIGLKKPRVEYLPSRFHMH